MHVCDVHVCDVHVCDVHVHVRAEEGWLTFSLMEMNGVSPPRLQGADKKLIQDEVSVKKLYF